MIELLGVNTNTKVLRGVVTEIALSVDNTLALALKERTSPYVLVVHLPDKMSPNELLKQFAVNGEAGAAWDFKFAPLRGVLFIKQVAYCGLARNAALELMDQYAGRVHIMSYSVPPLNPTDSTYRRFVAFRDRLATLAPDAAIPWHLLEPPPWPEEAVAVYLALVAKGRDVDVLETSISSETWKKADVQMKELSEGHGSLQWNGFDLECPENNMTRLEPMRQVLANVAERQKN